MQSVSPLQETAASFRSRSPFLSPPQPALLLVPAALGAAARTIRNRDPFHAPLPRLFLIASRVESGVGGYQARQPSQPLLMNLDRRQQQITVGRPLLINLVVASGTVSQPDFRSLAEAVPMRVKWR